ncbi:hypothetical protein [Terrimonas alba]|uniref:hypothetical protein n=1 Tax=Terrimonas alba TaxID=3349636 RepID=UPI0035F2E9B3
MKQAETLSRETAFSLSELRTIAVLQHNSFNYNKTKTDLYLQNTVNNYLKTPEEMDADFFLEMNSLKSHARDQYNKLDTTRRPWDRHNEYIPDNIHSGFMEENY